MNNKRIGDLGEAIAEILLTEKGYRILSKNFRCKYGEIDIIARKGDVTAFVEVKTRLSDKYGTGAESVTPGKRRHIRNCADYYLNSEERMYDYEKVDFQVIEIHAAHFTGLEF